MFSSVVSRVSKFKKNVLHNIKSMNIIIIKLNTLYAVSFTILCIDFDVM